MQQRDKKMGNVAQNNLNNKNTSNTKPNVTHQKKAKLPSSASSIRSESAMQPVSFQGDRFIPCRMNDNQYEQQY